MTRREWLAMVSTAPFARRVAADRAERVAQIVSAFARQGIHRTGTEVDRMSAEWLAGEVRDAGLTPTLEPFALSRVEPIAAALTVRGRQIPGVPLFDAAFTGAAGIEGRFGPVGADVELGLAESAPNAAAAGTLGDARRTSRHKAMVCVTRGGRPGLCPSNADAFLKPFGPPVLQVSSEEGRFLEESAREGAAVHLVAHVARKPVEALNVTARLAGADRSLPPLVVMTPRSGWWTCASERGGGIACWLELMRELKTGPLARDVVFVASSGHELGHLGINAFVDKRPGIVARSAGWMHFGANIGAAQDPGNTVQASDDSFEKLLADDMIAAGLAVTRRVPRGTVPGGEAEVVHRGGGRYVSMIGRNALFHNPADRGPEAIDPNVISSFADVFVRVARSIAGAVSR
ncbi:MAG TPA: hypothetical protein VK504_24985 [Vicinamibacterales bacterium]|nr:hypothetical protein [Vicinamibacterales bacterium]